MSATENAAPLLVLKKITAILDAFSLARPEMSLAEIRAESADTRAASRPAATEDGPRG